MPRADDTPGGGQSRRDRVASAAEQAGGPSTTKRDGSKKSTGQLAAEGAAMAAGAPKPVAGAIGWASTKAARVAMVLAVVSAMVAGMLFFGASGGMDRDAHYGTAKMVRAGDDPRLPKDHLYAYQSAALRYSDTSFGGPVPWSLIAAIAQLSTEHGKYSPYPDDTCDRAPERPPVRNSGPARIYDPVATGDESATTTTTAAPTTTVAAADTCGGRASTFPQVYPPIGDVEAGEGLGPFLLLPQALTGQHSDVDPQMIAADGSGDDPRSATTFIAYELDRIRRVMIEDEGWAAPNRSWGEGGSDAEEYATEFWVEAAGRLPIADPRNATCQTPQPGVSPNEVAAAVAATWRCELLRAGELHTYAADGTMMRLDGTAAVDLIVSEALAVAWAHSGLGDRNTSQDLCGRLPVATMPVFGGATNVTVIGDSLTEGISGKIEPLLAEAGIPPAQIVVDFRRGRPTSEGVRKVQELAPTSGVVVAALGTNDSNPDAFAGQIDAFMAAVPATVKVLWLTIDKPGDDPLNAVLAERAAAHANMVVADWKAEADANPAWRAGDQIHLNGSGYTARAKFIVANLPGGSSAAVRPPQIGGRDAGEGEEKPTAAPDSQPVGVFPLTAQMFEAFNPTPGASRCDLGPNIHAAVRAFIAGETVPLGEGGEEPARLGHRGVLAGEWNAMVGGWWAMPWVLGTGAERDLYLDDGPRRRFVPSAECRELVTDWVNELAERDEFAALDADTVSSFELDDLPDSPVGADECDGRADGSVESLAAGIASAQRFALDTTVGGEVDPTVGDDGQDFAPDDVTSTTLPPAPGATTTTVPGDDDDVDEIETPVTTTPDDTGDPDDSAATTVPDLDAIEQLQANLAGISAWMNHQVLVSPDSVLGEPVPGVDVMLARFSPSGRSLSGIPAPAIVEVSYAAHVVELAVAFGGIIAHDTRFDPEGDPFAVAARLTTVSPGSGFAAALAGVPAALLDAVNRAIAQAPTMFPDCKVDAAFLLATARAESGPWWDQIGPDGTMVPALENYATAMGPFQFIRITWPSYASDGNGDGIADPQNTYDAALASLKFQCPLGQRYNGDLTDPETAWQVAVDYHDGPGRNRAQSEGCRADGHHTADYGNIPSSCRGERYGQLRVQYADEYRAMIAQASLIQGGMFAGGTGGLGDRAVQYAMGQVGKLYCRDDMPAKCKVPFGSLNRQFSYTRGGLVPSGNPGAGIGRMGPDAFDCSGLVSAAYMMAGFDIGVYIAHDQFVRMPSVPITDLMPGDLLFYEWQNDGSRIDHVAIYVGGGMMVHASGHGRGVVYEQANLGRGFVGAGRPAALPGAPL